MVFPPFEFPPQRKISKLLLTHLWTIQKVLWSPISELCSPFRINLVCFDPCHLRPVCVLWHKLMWLSKCHFLFDTSRKSRQNCQVNSKEPSRNCTLSKLIIFNFNLAQRHLFEQAEFMELDSVIDKLFTDHIWWNRPTTVPDRKLANEGSANKGTTPVLKIQMGLWPIQKRRLYKLNLPILAVCHVFFSAPVLNL